LQFLGWLQAARCRPDGEISNLLKDESADADRCERSTPNFPLSRNEAADLAAYIGSLRNSLRK
jgi:hypothetical protein